MSGNEREKLRNSGQFWTPPWVAEAMVMYAIRESNSVFDPAAGRGAFCRALGALGGAARGVLFRGYDTDPEVFRDESYEHGSPMLEVRDFMKSPPSEALPAVVANPPYIRHHRLSPEMKRHLRETSIHILGYPLDGRAGLHVFFLIQALHLLAPGGRLAFIVPSDTFEGVFARRLWQWISVRYSIENVVTFAPEATPFPEVDTNAVVVCIRRIPPARVFRWIRVIRAHPTDLARALVAVSGKFSCETLMVDNRVIEEGVRIGLTRAPLAESCTMVLADFARVMRGIATGANDFFFLNRSRAESLRIPQEFLKSAIGRTRDVPGDIVSVDTVNNLEGRGRPTLLLSLDDRPKADFPPSIQDYLRSGEVKGIHLRALIKARKPWYRMERRQVPPLLFAYLGRRNVRFIINRAGIIPLTGFLCVYPHRSDPESVEALWRMLNQRDVLSNLGYVGKSYGGGAVKVEPRALERLPVPDRLAESIGRGGSPPSTEAEPGG